MTGRRLAKLLVHASLGALLLALLLAVGQPILSDGLWRHLAMGRAYAMSGPWLDAHPLLFAATGPPAADTWLFDLLSYQALELGGFAGLRTLHVLWVAAIAWGAWRLLRRASGSGELASVGTALFAILAGYALSQPGPQLVTVTGLLLLCQLCVRDAPTPWDLALAALLAAAWVNLDSGFLWAPLLLAAALLGAVAARLLGGAQAGSGTPGRLGLLCAVVVAAGLLNPAGADVYLDVVREGAATSWLGQAGAGSLLGLPTTGLVPSPASWLAGWLVLLASAAVFAAGRRSRARDAGLAAMSLVALAAVLVDARFLWLLLPALLLLARGLRSDSGKPAIPHLPLAALGLALVPGFFALGDWSLISQALPTTRQGYAQPYPAAKYFGHAIWFLRDSELEGRIFADAAVWDFGGFWLAPRLQGPANGGTEPDSEAWAAYRALSTREGARDGESFAGLLERLEIDVFLATGSPEIGPPSHVRAFTTSYLEGAEGWIQVFRNLRCAVYLRDHPRNRANLDRVAAYYQRVGIPFEPERGFDPWQIVRGASQWGFQHGVFPGDLANLVAETRRERDPERAVPRLDRLASIYAVLGLYERTLRVDLRIAAMEPEHEGMLRRRLWSLLRLGRVAEAEALMEELAQHPSPLLASVTASARSVLEARDFDPGSASRLPLFSRTEIQRLLWGYRHPRARRSWRRPATAEPLLPDRVAEGA